MKIEQFKPMDHYDTIKQWWQEHNHDIVPVSDLSPLGLVVKSDEEYICAAWFLKTDSSLCILELLVGNPKAKKRDIIKGIDLLLEYFTSLARILFFNKILIMAKLPGLIKHLKKRDFDVEIAGVTNLIKGV